MGCQVSTVIDTPEGIAFFRALARQGAARLKQPGIIKTIKTVYGFSGSPATVRAMLDEYIEGTLETRAWDEDRGQRAAAIVTEATRRAEEEYGDQYTKDTIDGNVQALFEGGSITEQEGNDACLLLFVAVVRQYAGRR